MSNARSVLSRELLGLALLLVISSVQSQETVAADPDPRVAWLAAHAVKLHSVDPADVDFADLKPLRATLKGVRVVLLGEQDHGDGTTFLAKTRLIRFLHEQMGFDVLAFESGFYDCPKAWELLTNGEEPRKAVPKGVFGVWTLSREFQPMIDYLGRELKRGRPLELTGADPQTSGTVANESLIPDLAAMLSRIDPKLATGPEWDRVVYVLNHLNDSSWEAMTEPVPSAKEQEAFAATIEHWRSLIAAHDHAPATQPWSGAYWRQFLTSLRAVAEQNWRIDYHDLTGNPDAYAIRDRQMGKNLVWLARERYPKRKIIVWAATFHDARRTGTIETGDAKRARLYAVNSPMGEVAWKELGNELFSLAFSSAEGESAREFAKTAKPIPTPSHDSLEDLFVRAGLTTAFVDFRHPPAGGAWLRAPISGQLLGHFEMRADWTGVVDGVLFIRTMQRSHKEKGARSDLEDGDLLTEPRQPSNSATEQPSNQQLSTQPSNSAIHQPSN